MYKDCKPVAPGRPVVFFFVSSGNSPIIEELFFYMILLTYHILIYVSGLLPLHADPLHPVQLGCPVCPLLSPGVRQVLWPDADTSRAFLRRPRLCPFAAACRQPAHLSGWQRPAGTAAALIGQSSLAQTAWSVFLRCAALQLGCRRRQSIRCRFGAYVTGSRATTKLRTAGGWEFERRGRQPRRAHLTPGIHQPRANNNFCAVRWA